MRFAAGLAALSVICATPALAAPLDQPTPPADSGEPYWIRTPNGDDFARYYPARAARLGVGGRAVAHCRVSATGALVDCTVAEEDPPGFGFGEAALKIMPKFKMRPLVVNGVPSTGGEINIPIRFGASR